MGWSGSLNANSAVGSAITYTPDTTTAHGYTVGTFTAPRKGVYRFILRGSGGTYGLVAGGVGGYTVGYLLLEAGQTVYVGAGGTCSAAFVSSAYGAALKNISRANLYFVAGAGGGGGNMWDNGWNNKAGVGGAGGGASGDYGKGDNGSNIAAGGTQTSGYAYGDGGRGGYSNHETYSTYSGDGGDGLYGGIAAGYNNGGGGGSGYINTSSIKVGSKTYTNTTQQGGGAGSSGTGSIEVSYYARAELPVVFNGTTLERLIYNGVEVESLIYDGVKLFFDKLRRWGRCLSSTVPVSA